MMGRTIAPARQSLSSDIGLAISIALAVPLAMTVEGLAVVMVDNAATRSELAVLGLFAVPLLTVWAAIALSLWTRPVRLRWSAAALLLLLPPLLLAGFWNG
jgi:zinc transporter ZupT